MAIVKRDIKKMALLNKFHLKWLYTI